MDAHYKWKLRLNFHKEIEHEIKKINSGYLSDKSIDNIYKRLIKKIESKGFMEKDKLN